MVQVWMLSDMWLSKYGLLENFNAKIMDFQKTLTQKILSFGYVLDFDL